MKSENIKTAGEKLGGLKHWFMNTFPELKDYIHILGEEHDRIVNRSSLMIEFDDIDLRINMFNPDEDSPKEYYDKKWFLSREHYFEEQEPFEDFTQDLGQYNLADLKDMLYIIFGEYQDVNTWQALGKAAFNGLQNTAKSDLIVRCRCPSLIIGVDEAYINRGEWGDNEHGEQRNKIFYVLRDAENAAAKAYLAEIKKQTGFDVSAYADPPNKY